MPFTFWNKKMMRWVDIVRAILELFDFFQSFQSFQSFHGRNIKNSIIIQRNHLELFLSKITSSDFQISCGFRFSNYG
jgi:ABC-type antimicrobial peptide transport system permease subunit